jgi:hypothetical protein
MKEERRKIDEGRSVVESPRKVLEGRFETTSCNKRKLFEMYGFDTTLATARVYSTTVHGN